MIAQQQAKEGSGSQFVMIIWANELTIWDFDNKTEKRLYAFEREYLPVCMSAHHVCCPPLLTVCVVAPVAYAMLDKRTRRRTIIHRVSEDRIVSVLANYGIFKDMLPTDMGGTIQLNQSDWIAKRRLIEAEVAGRQAAV